MMRVAVLIALALSCTSPDRARHALAAQGFTDVTLSGFEWGCGRDDTCTGFEATASNGMRVHGAVGCDMGCGAGCSIRINQ